MNKSTLGALKLSPIKEEGRFVFINPEIRMNNKLNKGDSIKIYVTTYQKQGDRHLLTSDEKPLSKIVVRGNVMKQEHTQSFASVEDLYSEVCTAYRNQFYFGKNTES